MGERTPHLDPDCRGVFFGLSAMHEKRDMIRAVMEGVAFSLNDCMNILREMNIEIQDMMACGGGGTSAVWRQMLADLYGCQVSTVNSKEGPALGAAILAFVGAGIYPDVVTACDALVKKNKTQEPDKENAEKYAPFYRLYTQLYKDLKEDFKELAAIQ
jgi:xylulokinase